MHDFGSLAPAGGQRRGIEVQVGAVVADKEILRRVARGDEGKEGRARHALQEAGIEPGRGAGAGEVVAEQVLADGAGERGGNAQPRAGARHVPA
ncbi:hypothetical protein D9M69_451420 [compost metagenome]